MRLVETVLLSISHAPIHSLLSYNFNTLPHSHTRKYKLHVYSLISRLSHFQWCMENLRVPCEEAVEAMKQHRTRQSILNHTFSCSLPSQLLQGTVLLSFQLKMDGSCNMCWRFEADVYMLYNTNGGVKPGFQGTVYVNSIMQNADIIEIVEKESLSAGERACVWFRFLRHPEFLRVGSKILFREGRTKGIGEIKRLIPDTEGVGQEHHSTSPHRRKPSR